MKHFKILLATLLLFLIAASCKKDPPLANPDYRDQYVGNYSCHKLCTFWLIDMDQPDTTFNGMVNIAVSKVSTAEDLIVVQQDTLPIDSSGHYFGFFQPPGYRTFVLNFRNDSIFISSFSGGLGGGTTCNIAGKK